ncbi:MAG: protein kinase, partial [Gemmatimonadales bacterium]
MIDGPANPTSFPEPLAAAIHDRYRIEREIGRGGMATVFLAQDLKHRRPVAIKVLLPELSSSIASERFLREITLAANLNHPHILGVYDSGEADGVLYYVMPYVEGESLRDRLRREGALSAEDALAIVREVADALTYAHTAGVIHRDIKPENILLSGGHAVVSDFGIAHAVNAAGGERLTSTGLAIGTPSYMSPEQASGERRIDARSDIYSLACVAYEMLGGDPPFTGGNPQAIMARHAIDTPLPLRTVRPTISEETDAVLEKALAKVPADRFATAVHLSEALARAHATKATERDATKGARRDAPQSSLGARSFFGARYSRLSRLGGVVLIILALAAGGIWVSRRSAKASSGDTGLTTGPVDAKFVVGVMPFQNLSADTSKSYFAAGMTEEIASRLSRVSALRVLSRASLGKYRDMPDRLPKMAKELGAGSIVEGSIRTENDRVRVTVQLVDARSSRLVWSRQYDRPLSNIFAVQTEVAEGITGALEAVLTPAEARRAGRPPTVNLDAYELYLRASRTSGRNQAAHMAAATMLRRAIELDSTFTRAYVALARRYLFLGDRNAAYKDSGWIMIRRAIAVDPENSSAYVTLGGLQADSGHLTLAKASLLRATELDPSSAMASQDLSWVLDYLGDYDNALSWAVRALPIEPTNPFSPFHVGAILIHFDDAALQRLLDSSLKRFEGFPRLEILYALLDVRRGQTQAAMARVRTLAINNPGDDEVQDALAEIAFLTGAPDAGELLEPIQRLTPQRRLITPAESVRSLYALTLDESGKHEIANSLWNAALAGDNTDMASGNE